MSRISQTRGKNTELAIAKELGAKRNHFEREDLSHPILSVEVKHRKELPRFLVQCMAQAKAAAPVTKIPCVVLHGHGKSHLDDLVVMRLGDLKDIVGD